MAPRSRYLEPRDNVVEAHHELETAYDNAPSSASPWFLAYMASKNQARIIFLQKFKYLQDKGATGASSL
jgi:hypothetical protein